MTFRTNLMIDPVVASDGFTYERESIEQWLASHDDSPTTNQPLEHKMLIPNHLVRKQVVSWCEQNDLPVPKVPKRPVAKAVAGGGAAAPLVQKPVVMCELHPKEQLRVFCVNCNRAVCFMCAVDIDMCKSHDIKAFDPLIEELKTDIEGWARALRECNEAAELTCALIQADGDTKKRVYVQEIDKQVAALLQQVRSSSAARAAAIRAILQKRQAREELVTGAAVSPEVGVKGSGAAVAVAAAVGRVKAPIPPASAAEFRAAAATAAAVGQVIVASDVIDPEEHAVGHVEQPHPANPNQRHQQLRIACQRRAQPPPPPAPNAVAALGSLGDSALLQRVGDRNKVQQFAALLGFRLPGKGYRLAYTWSRDGRSAASFHQRCVGQVSACRICCMCTSHSETGSCVDHGALGNRTHVRWIRFTLHSSCRGVRFCQGRSCSGFFLVPFRKSPRRPSYLVRVQQ